MAQDVQTIIAETANTIQEQTNIIINSDDDDEINEAAHKIRALGDTLVGVVATLAQEAAAAKAAAEAPKEAPKAPPKEAPPSTSSSTPPKT